MAFKVHCDFVSSWNQLKVRKANDEIWMFSSLWTGLFYRGIARYRSSCQTGHERMKISAKISHGKDSARCWSLSERVGHDMRAFVYSACARWPFVGRFLPVHADSWQRFSILQRRRDHVGLISSTFCPKIYLYYTTRVTWDEKWLPKWPCGIDFVVGRVLICLSMAMSL